MIPLWHNDLPEGFGPMAAKELRQSLRRGSFVLPFLALQFVALVAVVVELRAGGGAASPGHAGVFNLWQLASAGPFWLVAGAACMLIMPLSGLLLMEQELDASNHELLLLTPLTRWAVVLGKFATLWGLSAVTFVSLLPYLVLRYLIGGIEWWQEAACAGTVLGGAALIGAGAIGASSFRHAGARLAVFVLYFGSTLCGCGIPLAASAAITGGCGILYHCNVVAAIGCYSLIGLGLARARLRLALGAYEVNPSGLLIGLLIFAPFVIGFVTAITLGLGGIVGLVGMGLVASQLDARQRAPGAA